MDALPLSVLLLARDEAARLGDLLPRLGFARETVVVVDAATRDGTREVAARHGAKVAERALDGFGPQRAFGLERTSQPWVLWLDADERLDEAAVAAVRDAVLGGTAAGYRIERVTWFLGKRIRHCGWQGEKVLRLFRREAASFDDARLHERVSVRGEIGTLAGTIEHRSYERWADCREKLVRYAEAGAAAMRARGRRAGALDLVLRPPLRFLRMYVLQAGFLDGAHGLALCALAAAQVLLKYAAVWAEPRDPGAGNAA
ncbi:MAG TPA: glycosyltransferase family 2 protein [Candidatus Eisenbacteria bacterium]|jgi:glycosyltransferase involved in cell wall biosynthesis